MNPRENKIVLQIEDFLKRFLKMFYIVENINILFLKRRVSIIVDGFMIITYLECLAIGISWYLDSASQWKIMLSFVVSYTSSMATWLSIRTKMKRLAILIRHLFLTSTSHWDHRKTNLAFCVILCMPILFSIAYSIGTRLDFARNLLYLTYGKYIENISIRCTVVFIKTLLLTFMYPTFTSLITLLYCMSCHQCGMKLRYLRSTVQHCHYSNFNSSVQSDIL